MGKKKRGGANKSNEPQNKPRSDYVDLSVPLPLPTTFSKKAKTENASLNDVSEILLDRYSELDYTSLAFRHDAFGAPTSASPPPLLSNLLSEKKITSCVNIFTRRHAVLEAVSDLSKFTSDRGGYDIHSVSPSNHPAFEAACDSANIDIITLNDNSNRKSLSFRLNRGDILKASQNGIVFEIVWRSAFESFESSDSEAATELRNLVSVVNSFRSLTTSLSPAARIILSSGGPPHTPTSIEKSVAGAKAGFDLLNWCESMLNFKRGDECRRVVFSTANEILKLARQRRQGRVEGVGGRILEDWKEENKVKKVKNGNNSNNSKNGKKRRTSKSENDPGRVKKQKIEVDTDSRDEDGEDHKDELDDPDYTTLTTMDAGNDDFNDEDGFIKF